MDLVKVLCPTGHKKLGNFVNQRRSSQPISWLSSEELNHTQQKKHASVTKYTTT